MKGTNRFAGLVAVVGMGLWILSLVYLIFISPPDRNNQADRSVTFLFLLSGLGPVIVLLSNIILAQTLKLILKKQAINSMMYLVGGYAITFIAFTISPPGSPFRFAVTGLLLLYTIIRTFKAIPRDEYDASE